MSLFNQVPVQRTEKGLRYEKFINNVRNLLDGKTPEEQKKAVQANEQLAKALGLGKYKAVTPAAVHVDTLLSTFSVMYANDEYIGERLMPAIPVSKRSDKYASYPKRERFAYPDDEIGQRSSPNELDASRTTDNYSVKDYGFMNYLDLEVMANEDAPFNEMIDLVESINEGIALKREKRIATIVQASGNYGGNTANATTKWDTATTGGTIVADILAADAGLWSGPSPTLKLGVTTLDNWNTCIVNNPAIRDLFKYVSEGLTTTQAFARYFGLDDVLIGRPREDTANSGQTASYSRIWTTDFFAILRVAKRPTLRSLHFGSTFRMNGDPVTTQWNDPKIGKRGGVYAKVAVSEDHKVVAGDAAFFINDCKT
jgi:hypothetical protein